MRHGTLVSVVATAWCLAAVQSERRVVAAFSPQQTQHAERVEVRRILVDVRVLDGAGQPLLGLTASDFAATIDGRRASIESAVWRSNEPAITRARSSDTPNASVPAEAEGERAQRIVVLVQRKFDLTDATGFMRANDDLARLPDRFTAGTRFSVMSFDTQPHVWADFTDDRESLRSAIRSMRSAAPPPGGTLTDLVDGKRVEVWPASPPQNSIEATLESLGRALGRLPGAKTILIVGYGLGVWDPRLGIIRSDVGYDDALAALSTGRVNVFCIDTTQAEYHVRQEGLIQLALDSGGRFWSTREFTSKPFDEFRALSSGFYQLSVVPDDAQKGRHDLSVRLRGRRGTALAKRSFNID